MAEQTMEKQSIEAAVTDQAIARLEAGGLPPWQYPESGPETCPDIPSSGTTGRAFAGLNIPILWMGTSDGGFRSPVWVTREQAESLGTRIRPDETPRRCIGRRTRTEGAPKGLDTAAVVSEIPLFNLEQAEHRPGSAEERQPEREDPDRALERIVDRMCASGLSVFDGSERAFYAPRFDQVWLPERLHAGRARTEALLAQLVYATGHRTRLGWLAQVGRRFEDDQARFAFGALVAEMAVGFTCADIGLRLGARPVARDDRFLEAWIGASRADERYLGVAASVASRSWQYLTGRLATVPAAQTTTERVA